MDTSIIYSKTARGVLELKNGAKNLAPPLAGMLRRVDGRSSVGVMAAGLTPQEQQQLEQILAALETQQLIRVFARRSQAVDIAEDDLTLDQQRLPTIQIEELSAEEGVMAWAEARRGARELVQLGFYVTAHLDPDGNITHRHDVLIVEDDDAIAQLMKTYLTRRGFQVNVVADGQQALQVLEEGPLPHIVLLDVNLPNINGFDILAYIRSEEKLKQLPAVMVTAQVSDADVLRGLKGGADGYIFKPFEWATLHNCIKRVLGLEA